MQTTVLKTLWGAHARAVGRRTCLIVHPVWGEDSHSFNRYLLSTFNAPGTVQATMARAAKETDGVPTSEARAESDAYQIIIRPQKGEAG